MISRTWLNPKPVPGILPDVAGASRQPVLLRCQKERKLEFILTWRY